MPVLSETEINARLIFISTFKRVKKVTRLKCNVCNDVTLLTFLTRRQSAIQNDVLRRRIKHWATADGFAKCLAEMAEARITDFCRGFSYVVASRAQQFGRAFHSQIAQVLRNSEADFARENPAEIKGAAADFLTKCFERGRVRQIARQQFSGPLDAFTRNAFLAHAK